MAQLSESPGDYFGARFYQEINGLVNNRNVLGAEYTHHRRTYELGLLLNRMKMVSGFVFRHQFFLNSTRPNHNYQIDDYTWRPYLIYHFVYNTNISERYLKNSIGTGTIRFKQEYPGVPTVNTMEHYLGFGTEVDMVGAFFMNVYVGGGLYFYRSNSRVVTRDDRLLPEQHIGFTWNMSFGIGYRLH